MTKKQAHLEQIQLSIRRRIKNYTTWMQDNKAPIGDVRISDLERMIKTYESYRDHEETPHYKRFLISFDQASGVMMHWGCNNRSES